MYYNLKQEAYFDSEIKVVFERTDNLNNLELLIVVWASQETFKNLNEAINELQDPKTKNI